MATVSEDRGVLITIIAHEKEHLISWFLKCIECQTYPPEKTTLWVRGLEGKDRTIQILSDWVEKIKEDQSYLEIDFSAVPSDTKTVNLRQESIEYAKEHQLHYFVANIDNLVFPETLETLLDTHLAVIGPLLVTGTSLYSNYHAKADAGGYYQECQEYHWIHKGEVKGLLQVDVIHGTYVVRYEALKDISYQDGTEAHEYVVFSRNLRKAGVLQYIDSRELGGYMAAVGTKEELEKLEWLKELAERIGGAP